LQIGTGTVSSGVFSSIDWGNTLHFIKLEADFTGGNTYVTLGTQELMSVPYAMYASKTDTASLNLTNRFADKAPVNNPTFTGTVSGIDKTMVGLGNVDNTTDVNKPVSTATQTALATKAPINNPQFTGTVGGITKSMVDGLENVNNTSDEDKPVSSATQTALAAKAPINNPNFTGTVGGITNAMVVGLENVENTTDLSKPVSSATQAALDTKFNKADFPSGSSANEILYWNGTKWISLAPGTTGQVLTMSSDGLSWGCIPASSAVAPSTPTLAVNTPMTDITIETTGVTGIVGALLPPGLEATWSANVITISGMPTAVGTSQYSIYLRVSCGNPIFVEGEITITATAPDAPTGVVATAGDGSASIAFVAPTNDGGRQITGYTVTSNAYNINASGPTSPIKVLGLSNGTAYTFTVVATNEVNNSEASAVSNEVTPAPVCPTATITYNDYDYKTVGIGDQCWMAENLRTREYRDGTAIPFDKSGGDFGFSNETWSELRSGAHTIYRHDSTLTTGNLAIYGYLYNWYAVNDSRKLCPSGWHVPTDSDWTTLTSYLGESSSGTAMKESVDLWTTDKGSNTSGFSALPGGFRYINGQFSGIRTQAFFWSASESGFLDGAFVRQLIGANDNVNRFGDSKVYGASVRCLLTND
jgi:uncharacterized protein (TIGR02145 family)